MIKKQNKKEGFRIKKFLITLIIILSTSMMLASREMQWELITYWKTNEYVCWEFDELIWLYITENRNISVGIMRESNYISFVFETDTKIDDYVEFFLTEKLPYSEQFRKDLLKCLKENWNYYNTFEKTLDPYYEWFDDYHVYVKFSVDKEAVCLEID